MTRTPLLEMEQGLDCPRNYMSGPAQVATFQYFRKLSLGAGRPIPLNIPPEVLDRMQRSKGIAVVQSSLR